MKQAPEAAEAARPATAPKLLPPEPGHRPRPFGQPSPTPRFPEPAAVGAESEPAGAVKPKPKPKLIAPEKVRRELEAAKPEPQPLSEPEPVSRPVAVPQPQGEPLEVESLRPEKAGAAAVEGVKTPPSPVDSSAQTAEPEAGEAAAEQAEVETHESRLFRDYGITETDLPEAGTVIDASNVERWTHLLGPSIRWAVRRGAKLNIIDPEPVIIEDERQAATERYHAQVSLSEDKRSLRNYVAGIPFPQIDLEDPDVATRIMFNLTRRYVVDNIDAPKFACVGADMDPEKGMQVDREFRFDHFRRLHYTGRLIVPPVPTWETPDGIRYREMLAPITAPFDLKGAGFTYTRYLDPERQDDSWLYFPQSRRVRRLSTAQRSEGIYGTDIDLDSYGGFAANPAWFNFQLLGKKTILAPFHSRHYPIKWADKPGDFMFDDVWEPRETYIVAARSLLPGYNFSLRVIYIDKASWLVPYAEVYDQQGQLWRSYVQLWAGNRHKTTPESKIYYESSQNFLRSVLAFDMLQNHATRCRFPAPEMPLDHEPFIYWQGDDGSVHPEDFDVSQFINAGR